MADNKRKKRKKSVFKQLGSAIMYLSDVFVFLMVVTWVLYILLSIPAAWIELLKYGSTSIFSDLKDASVLPLSVGGAIWLVRVCITHNNAQKKGKKLTPDFPNIDENGNVISTVEMCVNNLNANENNYMEEDIPPVDPNEDSAG